MLFNKLQIAKSLVAVFLAIFLSGPAFAGSGAPPAGPTNSSLVVAARRPPPPQQLPMTTAPTTTDDTERYAAREAEAKGLESFTGGARGIYIGSSALVVVLLVVLIVVLL